MAPKKKVKVKGGKAPPACGKSSTAIVPAVAKARNAKARSMVQTKFGKHEPPVLNRIGPPPAKHKSNVACQCAKCGTREDAEQLFPMVRNELGELVKITTGCRRCYTTWASAYMAECTWVECIAKCAGDESYDAEFEACGQTLENGTQLSQASVLTHVKSGYEVSLRFQGIPEDYYKEHIAPPNSKLTPAMCGETVAEVGNPHGSQYKPISCVITKPADQFLDIRVFTKVDTDQVNAAMRSGPPPCGPTYNSAELPDEAIV